MPSFCTAGFVGDDFNFCPRRRFDSVVGFAEAPRALVEFFPAQEVSVRSERVPTGALR
jgi:hypothetical protein